MNPYSHFPFGLGSHKCLGRFLVVYFMQIFLGLFYRDFTTHAMEGQQLPVWAESEYPLVVKPKGGVQLILKPRKLNCI